MGTMTESFGRTSRIHNVSGAIAVRDMMAMAGYKRRVSSITCRMNGKLGTSSAPAILPAPLNARVFNVRDNGPLNRWPETA